MVAVMPPVVDTEVGIIGQWLTNPLSHSLPRKRAQRMLQLSTLEHNRLVKGADRLWCMGCALWDNFCSQRAHRWQTVVLGVCCYIAF